MRPSAAGSASLGDPVVAALEVTLGIVTLELADAEEPSFATFHDVAWGLFRPSWRAERSAPPNALTLSQLLHLPQDGAGAGLPICMIQLSGSAFGPFWAKAASFIAAI